MLEKMPKVGDEVRFVGDTVFRSLDHGAAYPIEAIDEEGDAIFTDNAGRSQYITRRNFHLYELAGAEPEGSSSPRTDRDLIVELAYTVARLSRKVDALEDSLKNAQHDVGQALADASTADGKAEMLIDDVVMLDERTRGNGREEEESAGNPPVTKDTSRIDDILRRRGIK